MPNQSVWGKRAGLLKIGTGEVCIARQLGEGLGAGSHAPMSQVVNARPSIAGTIGGPALKKQL